MDWDIEKSTTYLWNNKKPAPAPPFQCAKYVNNALKAGGVNIGPVKNRYPGAPSACDYGPYLEAVGFEIFFDNTDNLTCERISYKPLQGDIAIFQPFKAQRTLNSQLVDVIHKHGHIQMFVDGVWISDFAQLGELYPGRDYKNTEDPFRIYRYTNLMCIKSTSKPAPLL
jgi:hypothetical protein